MAARWEETLDLMLRLQWLLGQGSLPMLTIGMSDRAQSEEFAEGTLSGAAIAFATAAPVYVAPDMAAVWYEAHRDFRPEPLIASDLLADAGFALLPEPVQLSPEDGASDDPVAQALLWRSFPPEVQHAEFPDGGVGVWTLGDQADWAGHGGQHGWVISWAGTLAFNDEPGSAPTVLAFQTLWTLMRQFRPRAEPLPRAAARRAARAKIEPDRMPTVMTLRRARAQPAEPAAGGVDYSCQWQVRGHWRNQYYGPDQPRRQKYIAPYIKGPEDKPLVLKGRAIEFVR